MGIYTCINTYTFCVGAKYVRKVLNVKCGGALYGCEKHVNTECGAQIVGVQNMGCKVWNAK